MPTVSQCDNNKQLLTVLRKLTYGKITKADARNRVHELLTELSHQRAHGLPLRVILLSKTALKFFTKPRGYAGCSATLDLIYENKSGGNTDGEELVDEWVLNLKACQAVRNRVGMLHDLITKEMQHKNKVSIASIACGPCAEAARFTQQELARQHWTLLDTSTIALNEAQAAMRKTGVPASLTVVNQNLTDGKAIAPECSLDVAYSLGLIDYFKVNPIISLIQRIHSALKEGGLMVLGNFRTGQIDRFFMEQVEWFLYHRTKEELLELLQKSERSWSDVKVLSDETGTQLLLIARKGLKSNM